MAKVTLIFLSLALLVGCAKKQPLVPEDMQKRSKERYGRQQMSMDSLNQTSAERGAAQHYDATQPVTRPGDEDEADE